ncbi:hypothetical protein BDV96DRAFT_51797 [Lophiotrema nucula]|uniref:Uncharacterized protein n=1 Tax=Lophiotrema nucula TaxID=690887 RepID=A0A6A5ZA49_9PLEO|nr:hypothetical protein BDV96DRAFT_51797 [Lophiotrema nucula]
MITPSRPRTPPPPYVSTDSLPSYSSRPPSVHLQDSTHAITTPIRANQQVVRHHTPLLIPPDRSRPRSPLDQSPPSSSSSYPPPGTAIRTNTPTLTVPPRSYHTPHTPYHDLESSLSASASASDIYLTPRRPQRRRSQHDTDPHTAVTSGWCVNLTRVIIFLIPFGVIGVVLWASFARWGTKHAKGEGEGKACDWLMVGANWMCV